MDRKEYHPRVIDVQVERQLSAFGAVCIEGPKWCGKTWTSCYHSRSSVFLADPAGNFQNRELARLDPALVLEGETPRLIDEWQEVPALWDAVRYKVDERNQKGQFILTGSATPVNKGILHSGAGRIARLRMRPMSLYESGHSSGAVSLQTLCSGEAKAEMTGEVKLTDLIDYIIRGGWPANQKGDIEEAALLPKAYLDAILEDDISRLDGVRRDSHKMELLLRSLARNESTTVSTRRLKNDIQEVDHADMDIKTVSSYLDVLQRLFLLDNQKPFIWHVRSSVRVKQAEKRHFADPSLAAALLKLTPAMLLHDLETLGFLFEALCERDLRIYGESFGAELYHYQDYNEKEIDAVLGFNDGEWGAFEIKLGANQIDKAAEGLLKQKEAIAAERDGKPPKVLGVICGLSSAFYQRPDGVYVIPITALRP